MGNREDLLVAAKHCLFDKGYERTTVRDLASTAGVSMAAIGYHYGSREALLNAALVEAMNEWGAELGRTLGADFGSGAAVQAERYRAMWDRVIQTFETDRSLWLASVEAFLQAARTHTFREHFIEGLRQGISGQAALLRGLDEHAVSDADVRSLGAVQMALLSGVMMQWLADPERAPRADDIVAGLRALAGLVNEGQAPTDSS